MFPPNASDPIKSRRLNWFFTTLNKDLKKKETLFYQNSFYETHIFSFYDHFVSLDQQHGRNGR